MNKPIKKPLSSGNENGGNQQHNHFYTTKSYSCQGWFSALLAHAAKALTIKGDYLKARYFQRIASLER